MHTIAMLIPLLVGVWVFLDARGRGKNTSEALLWGIGTFLILIIVLPLWLLLRPPIVGSSSSKNYSNTKVQYPHSEQEKYFCTNCQKSIEGLDEPRFCPYCGQRLIRQDSPVITIKPDFHE